MALGGNDREILDEIIKQQKIDNKRIERLETLEFHKARLGIGCIEWLDYDITGGAATMRVDVPAPVATVYGWTHLTAFFGIASESAGDKTLHMIVNAIAANYGYTYKFGRGGALTVISADGQASYIVSNLRGTSYAIGWVHIPYFPVPLNMGAYGDWTVRDSTQEAGGQVEKGEFGGINSGAPARTASLTFSASAGNITGYLYLYGWCPTWTIGQGPPD